MTRTVSAWRQRQKNSREETAILNPANAGCLTIPTPPGTAMILPPPALQEDRAGSLQCRRRRTVTPVGPSPVPLLLKPTPDSIQKNGKPGILRATPTESAAEQEVGKLEVHRGRVDRTTVPYGRLTVPSPSGKPVRPRRKAQR
eukprot:755547-Hanusia_phi.AAC.1